MQKRKEKIEHKLKALVEDHIEKWLNENDKKIGAYRKGLHSNVTDNDSAKMHTSHGTVQGYNCQAIVDSKHQVIVHGEAIGKRLKPFGKAGWHTGKLLRKYVSNETDCKRCQLRAKCLRNKDTKANRHS